jgi:hypothetical protein
MEYKQLENLLMRYNQATTDLENVRAWWIALTPTAQSSQKNIDSLVHYTESILKTEIVGWVREMQDVLAELASEQEKEAQDLSFDG